MIRAEATLHIIGGKESWFPCPLCSRKVTVKARFPLMWGFKTCRGCRQTWTLMSAESARSGFDDRTCDDLAGGEFQIELVC